MLSSTFRAYTQTTSRTSFTKKDEDGNPVRDQKNRPVRVTKEWPGEEVAFTGSTTADKAEFDAGEVVISRVVFYSLVPHEELVAQHQELGLSLSLNPDAEFEPDGAEVVVGSVEVGKSGAISVACPDPEAD